MGDSGGSRERPIAEQRPWINISRGRHYSRCLSAVLVWLIRPSALSVAAPVFALWFGARFLSAWLNRAPRTGRRRLHEPDVQFLRSASAKTWRYFRDWSGPESNWLIPDNVREDGAVVRPALADESRVSVECPDRGGSFRISYAA